MEWLPVFSPDLAEPFSAATQPATLMDWAITSAYPMRPATTRDDARGCAHLSSVGLSSGNPFAGSSRDAR